MNIIVVLAVSPILLISMACLFVLMIALTIVYVLQARRPRLTVRMTRYTETLTDGGSGDQGVEVEVENAGRPIKGVRVELHIRAHAGDAAISGMQGCVMRPVSPSGGELATGHTARFRLLDEELAHPTIPSTPEQRASRYLLRELTPQEIAVAVVNADDSIIRAVILKRPSMAV